MAERKKRKKPYAFNTEEQETPVETSVENAPDEEGSSAEEKEGGISSAPEERPKRKKKSADTGTRRRSAAAAGKRRRRGRKKKSRAAAWVLLILLLAILAGGAYYFQRTYVMIGKNILRRDTDVVDLRAENITLDTYKEIGEKLPEAKILWSVPLSGGSFDCEADSIALSRFENADLELLSYFNKITYVDAEQADLTPEQFEALSAALPEAEIDWCVPVGGERYPVDAESIRVSSLSAEDLPMLDYFRNLVSVDARACRDYDTILSLREARPDLELTWQVPISGKEYLEDAEEIVIDDASVSAASLEEAIRRLPLVRRVDAPANSWTEEEKETLRANWPEITFHWPVTICGTVYNGDETSMTLKGRKLSAADLTEIEKFGQDLPEIKHVDLSDTGIGLEDALRVKEVFPEAELDYSFELYGKKVSTADTFIDFTGVKMGSMDQLEAALPLLSKLEKVDMSDCGFSDEDMDKLNKRHEGVRFIWTMYFGRSSVIRTDDKGFIGAMDHYLVFTNNTIKKLGYCKDMLCLDLGHRLPSGLKLDFLYDMPQLQFLVLADCRATDIKPIGSLKNLVYLEMVMSYASDLTPIKDCTSLLDLDVCFSYETYGQKDNNFDVFVSLSDHLERLWYSSLMIDPARADELKKAMPKTDIHCIYATAQATGEGWRYHKRYYEMRDLLQMIYMADYGGRQYTKIIDGVEVPLSKEFLDSQRQPDWSKIRR